MSDCAGRLGKLGVQVGAQLTRAQHTEQRAEVRRSFITITVREQRPRSHHKDATQVGAGDVGGWAGGRRVWRSGTGMGRRWGCGAGYRRRRKGAGWASGRVCRWGGRPRLLAVEDSGRSCRGEGLRGKGRGVGWRLCTTAWAGQASSSWPTATSMMANGCFTRKTVEVRGRVTSCLSK